MTKITFKVGDKVRILNAERIFAAVANGFKTGGIYEVASIDTHGDPRIAIGDTTLCFYKDELKYIEKVAEQVAKFKVGDKVKVVDETSGWAGVSKGDEGVIDRINTDGSYEAKIPTFSENFTWSGEEKCFELISTKPTKNQRITTLEQTVADLQAEVEALKAAQGKYVLGVDFAKESPKLSANEQRKAIIAEAKAFVEKYTPIVRIDKTPLSSACGDVKITLNVNAEKRTVACIAHYAHVTSSPVKRAIAKCAPDDVFNVDIGKAIALGRALGLDVSKFEQAVKPSIAIGQTFRVTHKGAITGKVAKVTGMRPYFDGQFGKAFNHTNDSGWLGEEQVDIINDTEAQY